MKTDWTFMLDGTACTDEVLRYQRTTREAFGHHAPHEPLPRSISFTQQQRADWRANLLVAILFVGLVALALV